MEVLLGLALAFGALYLAFALWLKGGSVTSSSAEPPRLIVSERGAAAGAPPAPLVLFGHLAASPQIGELIAGNSTLSVVLIGDLESLLGYLAEHEVAGLVAQSRMEHSGEAQDAIVAFRARYPSGRPALYQAWDYNVQRGAERALECRADAVLMPAIDVNDMFRLLFGVMQRAGEGAPRPSSVDEHRALLEAHAPESPFWRLQDAVKSEFF